MPRFLGTTHIDDPNWNGDDEADNKGGTLSLSCSGTYQISTGPDRQMAAPAEVEFSDDEAYDVEGTEYTLKALQAYFGEERVNEALADARNNLCET